jgi:hypothetical protein
MLRSLCAVVISDTVMLHSQYDNPYLRGLLRFVVLSTVRRRESPATRIAFEAAIARSVVAVSISDMEEAD